MTIYLAICDDNIADRKHLERLLEREKDKRLKENYDVLYIDSFGSMDALLTTPVKYDIFLVDLTEGTSNGMTVAKELRHRGIAAPIVLLQSSISYGSYVNSPDDLIIIEKPLTKGQVSHLVDVAMENARSKTPLVEIRCQKDTRFVKHTDIVRAIPLEKFLTRICLADGECIDMTESLSSLEKQCEPFGCFIKCRKDLVNIAHINSLSGNSFSLTNGDIVSFNPLLQKNEILKVMSENMHGLR